MTDRGKVMHDLEHVIVFLDARSNMATPGSDGQMLLTGWTNSVRTALAMLKEQDARVMTLEEVINAKDKTDVWLDEIGCVVSAATISNWIEQKNHAVTFFYGIEHTAFEEIDYMNNNYNRTWRCWTSRPTPEQMRETPWEGEDNG